MIQQIIADLNSKFHTMLPDVKHRISTLEDFTIIPGSAFGLDPNVDDNLRDEIQRAKYYIVLRFNANGNRQQAVDAFKDMMENKLGLPSTNDVSQEVLPSIDYDEYAPTTDGNDTIDIDDDGNVVDQHGLTTYTGTSVGEAKPKYYAVEFRIEAPRGLPPPPNRGRLGGRVWNPHRELGAGPRNPRMIRY